MSENQFCNERLEVAPMIQSQEDQVLGAAHCLLRLEPHFHFFGSALQRALKRNPDLQFDRICDTHFTDGQADERLRDLPTFLLGEQEANLKADSQRPDSTLIAQLTGALQEPAQLLQNNIESENH